MTLRERASRHQERLIADALREVWWADSQGQPSCPRCYDGVDVQRSKGTRHVNPEIRVYYCRCCAYTFTDLTRTPFDRTHLPLRLWAQLAAALCDGRGLDALPGWGALRPRARRQLRHMQDGLRGSKLALRWAKELKARGFTGGVLAMAPLAGERKQRR